MHFQGTEASKSKFSFWATVPGFPQKNRSLLQLQSLKTSLKAATTATLTFLVPFVRVTMRTSFSKSVPLFKHWGRIKYSFFNDLFKFNFFSVCSAEFDFYRKKKKIQLKQEWSCSPLWVTWGHMGAVNTFMIHIYLCLFALNSTEQLV